MHCFCAISVDGQDVFFVTQAPLVGSDTNNGGYDLYDARIGGGFPQAEVVQPCEGEESCQGLSPSPPLAGSVASSNFGGPGNVKPPKPCKKGQVRKHGKCVKKSAKRKKHHKRAGDKRGAGR